MVFFLPLTSYAQDNLNEVQKEIFYYKVNIGDVVMCPYLGQKMISTFKDMGANNVIKNDSLETLFFNLDTLYEDKYIKNLFINKIGIPEWSIYEIKILENEK
tara:strand:- start:4667 stop:4972 length:306 start_codon:yes stop_codon:yes gene_type:complete